jgi:sulfur dioxygenase
MSGAFFFERFVDSESSTHTYLIADLVTKEAAIIDSVIENFEVYISKLREMNFQLKYLLETHVHADHITAACELLKKFPGAQIAMSERAGLECSYVKLQNESELKLGSIQIKAFSTPGHTIESMCYFVNNDRIFTGDTLFINSCGRTDFQAGSAQDMFTSLQFLKNFPNETLVFPGHDYNKRTVSTIGEQKNLNPLLALEKEDFIAEVSGWKLPPPKKIAVSVPRNLKGGAQ